MNHETIATTEQMVLILSRKRPICVCVRLLCKCIAGDGGVRLLFPTNLQVLKLAVYMLQLLPLYHSILRDTKKCAQLFEHTHKRFLQKMKLSHSPLSVRLSFFQITSLRSITQCWEHAGKNTSTHYGEDVERRRRNRCTKNKHKRIRDIREQVR